MAHEVVLEPGKLRDGGMGVAQALMRIIPAVREIFSFNGFGKGKDMPV